MNGLPSSAFPIRDPRTWVFVALVVEVVGLLFSIALSSLAFGVALLITGICVVRERPWTALHTGLEWPFLIFIFSVFVSVVFAIFPWDALIDSRQVLLISNVYMLHLALRDPRRIRWFLLLLGMAMGLQSAVDVTVFLLGSSHRLGVFQHYMTAAGIKMLLIVFLLPVAIRKGGTRLEKGILLPAVGVTMISLVLTQTRGSWIAVVAGLVLIFALEYRKMLVILVPAMILVYVGLPAQYKERVVNMVAISSSDTTSATIGSNRSRLRMWETGWWIFRDYPVVGIGNGRMHDVYLWYRTPIYEAEGCHLHNSYVQVLVTRGVLGFAAMVVLFVAMGRLFYRSWKQTSAMGFSSIGLGAMAALFGFLINAMVEYNFGDHEILVLLWTITGLAGISLKVESARRSHITQNATFPSTVESPM